ncbi:hypothetical protein B9X49_16445 [Acinetobacter baumannii]|nr:hypothetical protein B9X49_16445 [Acinetobacter baumannii]
MPHDVDLIILLAVGFGVALFFGYIAARLRLPPLIGYLIAGIIISPLCTRQISQNPYPIRILPS